MPPHIKSRADRGGLYYLIDGDVRRSLGTSKKGLAQHRLEQYIKGEFGLAPAVTVKEYYDQWIELREKELEDGLVRPSLVRDYKQHFSAYILPEFGALPLNELTIGALIAFRSKLLQARSLKTVRNIIDSSFRALWRAALSNKQAKDNPFEHVDWPRREARKPEPFTIEERDRILEWFREHDIFYYPWVTVLFLTGMRPSEAAALRWGDIDFEQGVIAVTKSRNLGKEGAPKTRLSDRLVPMSEGVVQALEVQAAEISKVRGIEFVFVNKLQEPINQHNWAHDYWAKVLEELKIPYRKFYATRHTRITEAIRAGENPLAVAQDCGNSVAMIQENYCGRINSDRTVLAPQPGKQPETLVVPTGLEPVDLFARMRDQVRQIREFKRLEKPKVA